MKVLKNIAELDITIAECDRARTDDELRAILSGFCMEAQFPAEMDPFSPEYHAGQMELYRSISGRDYSLLNEATPFDVDQAVVSPFPYSTKSCQTAGDHLVTLGEFLRHMHLPPGAKVLEFGPGWGNLTLAMAAMSYKVTCVDVEPRFCELIRRRASALSLNVEVINSDFGWASRVTDTYDAIVFFECFHHAADHLGLLKNLHGILKRNGRVYLGAEPILDSFPIPWGLRLDGQSLWSVRKFGWMELGFRDNYFEEALALTEWDGFRHSLTNPAIWELTSGRSPKFFQGNSPKLGTLTGRVIGEQLAFDRAEEGAALFGPYVKLPSGVFTARIRFAQGHPMVGRATFDICAKAASEVIACRVVDVPSVENSPREIELKFVLSSPRLDLEVRLFNRAGFSGRIESVEIVKD